MKRYVLIVAGGKGLRMGGEVPKQFLMLGGRPVLMRTLEAFGRYGSPVDIVLVLPEGQRGYWLSLCREHAFSVPHRLADGGETRYHSVRNGLALIGDEGIVAVHDGVRPFVSREVMDRCFAGAAANGAAVPVVPVTDTLRRVGPDGGSRTVVREEYRLVQTPQAFSVPLLKAAYRQPYRSGFTDDASVVEAAGIPVCCVEGDRRNIKLTTPFDLKVANTLLECPT